MNSLSPSSKIWAYAGIGILILAIAFPIFAHLDGLPLRIWDEARLAGNALEMYANHNWIVTYFDGTPDMWNTKPPLLIWLQVLSMHLVGINEIGIRLPSAIAGVITCLLLFRFFSRSGHFWLGVTSTFVLLTSAYVSIHHASRTGDYDAMLTLFTTSYCISYFRYNESQQKKYFYYTVLFIILAALTKGVAGLMFLPALLLYTIYTRQLKQVIKLPALYIGIAFFIVFVVGYYFLREHYNPGYIAAVRQNELGGRYNISQDKNNRGFWFYYGLWENLRFTHWWFLIIPGMAVGIFIKDKWLQKCTIYFSIVAVCYFTIISCGATKLDWYDLPLFPFISILAGLFIYSIFKILLNADIVNAYFTKPVLPYLFLLLVFFAPYKSMTEKMLLPQNGETDASDMGSFLMGALHGDRNIDGCYVSWKDYHSEQKWYTDVFRLKQKPIYYLDSIPDNMNGKKIAVYDGALKEYIEKNFVSKKLEDVRSVSVYEIESNKLDTASVRKIMMQNRK